MASIFRKGFYWLLRPSPRPQFKKGRFALLSAQAFADFLVPRSWDHDFTSITPIPLVSSLSHEYNTLVFLVMCQFILIADVECSWTV